jgi:nucleoid-associated protein YgaU
VVKPYDTLWSIAASHYRGDPREGVWRIERANGLQSALIRPGQVLSLP